MTYLDVSPMMVSLRTRPEEFDLKNRWLRHNPSRHCFRFEPSGHVTIRAACDCAFLMIHPDQERELSESYRSWLVNYWRPLEINREFASHFRGRSGIRRTLIDFVARLHRWLSAQDDRGYPAEVIYPAN